jgi:MYXO-CTERM domain-containing protein
VVTVVKMGSFGKCRLIEERSMKMRVLAIGVILSMLVFVGDAFGDVFVPSTYTTDTWEGTVMVGNGTAQSPQVQLQVGGPYAEGYGYGCFTSLGVTLGPTSFEVRIAADPTHPSWYTDCGWLFYLDGSLSLGQLQGIKIDTTIGNPTVRLWLDEGGDGQFFSWTYEGTGGYSCYGFAGSAGDVSLQAYAPGDVNESTVFDGNYSLADLQAGACPGISANTKVAIWIGIYGDPSYEQADFSEVDVQTPEPASLTLLALGGLALLRRRRQGRR